MNWKVSVSPILPKAEREDLLRKIASIFNNKTAIDTLSEIQAMVDITAPTISIVTNDWGCES